MLLIFFELGVTVGIDISVMDHCYNIRGLIRVITNCRGRMLEKKEKGWTGYLHAAGRQQISSAHSPNERCARVQKLHSYQAFAYESRKV